MKKEGPKAKLKGIVHNQRGRKSADLKDGPRRTEKEVGVAGARESQETKKTGQKDSAGDSLLPRN